MNRFNFMSIHFDYQNIYPFVGVYARTIANTYAGGILTELEWVRGVQLYE